MKVALISESLDVWRGGAETSTLQFINGLIDQGVELEVYTRSRLPSRPGMQVHTLRVGRGGRAVQAARFRREADEAVGIGKQDLVHAISPSLVADVYQPRGGTFAETIQRNLALRSTATSRLIRRLTQHLNPKQRMQLGLESKIMARESHTTIIAISDYVVRQLKQHYQLADQRICKIYNAVDPIDASDETRAEDRRQIRELYEVGDDELLVIMVAHNFKLKGVGTWIKTMEELRRRGVTGVRSLIIGKDKSSRWRKMVTAKSLDGVLQFTGPTQRSRAFYHAADVLVHPTFYDPCSRVVLEALDAGLVPVTTGFDGASEMIEDGVNGFVIDDPGDFAGLADRVMRLSDDSLRKQMTERSARVLEKITMQRHVDEVVRLYEELLERRTQR